MLGLLRRVVGRAFPLFPLRDVAVELAATRFALLLDVVAGRGWVIYVGPRLCGL